METLELNQTNTYQGLEYVIYRAPETGHFCAYIKLPDTHPWIEFLKQIKYYNMPYIRKRQTIRNYAAIPLEVHGGVTFGSRVKVPSKRFTKGWWIGWDYAHVGDFITLVQQDGTVSIPEPDGKIWDMSEVEADCKEAIEQVIKADTAALTSGDE